jgi:hypothetical protein
VNQLTTFPFELVENSETLAFQPMGFTLRITSNSPAILAAAQTSFGRFGATEATASPDFTFRLFEHNLTEGEGPPSSPVFRRDGHLLYQTTGPSSTLVVDVAAGVAFGNFSAATLAHATYFRWHFLELAFFMMLEGRGLMGVHGAALAHNGKAILLRAHSGGGKTTLAYAGARGKFQALAEDVVWLDAARHLWWGMPWSFHLLPDAKRLFPELAPYAPILQTNAELKLEVDLETLRPDSTTVAARPQAILFVERVAGGASRLEPVDPTQARRLWPAGQTGLEMQLPHHAQHIERLLDQNKLYRFYFGDDIDRGVELLEPLFE